jgi:hypothetical protein
VFFTRCDFAAEGREEHRCSLPGATCRQRAYTFAKASVYKVEQRAWVALSRQSAVAVNHI